MVLVVVTFRSMCARPSICHRLMDRSVVFLMVFPEMCTSTCAPGTPTLNILTPNVRSSAVPPATSMTLLTMKRVPEIFSGFPGFIGVVGLEIVSMPIPTPLWFTGTTPSILQEAITNPLTAYHKKRILLRSDKAQPLNGDVRSRSFDIERNLSRLNTRELTVIVVVPSFTRDGDCLRHQDHRWGFPFRIRGYRWGSVKREMPL